MAREYSQTVYTWVTLVTQMMALHFATPVIGPAIP